MLLLLVMEHVRSIGVRVKDNIKLKKVQKAGNSRFFCKINKFLVGFDALKRFSMGKHLLLEVYDVKFDLLNDGITIQEVMENGIKRAGMTILNIYQHCFVPQGCTIVIALSESHVSCHTWPEEGCIAIDVYTCGEGNPKLIALELLKYLNSDNYSIREIDR
jgi:S-adenosylmethionine decarboxylase